jgi:hypothetical protein
MKIKHKHNPTCLWAVSTCDCGAREKLMPEYIKRKKKILKRMEKDLEPKADEFYGESAHTDELKNLKILMKYYQIN